MAVISEQCAKAADTLARYRKAVSDKGAPKLGAAFKKAMRLHRSCTGCDCQCLPPEVRS